VLDSLLLLARIEGRLPFDERERLSADAVVHQAIAATGAAAAERVRVPAGSGGSRGLAMPGALAVVALRNLVDNALRYSPAGSIVDVALVQATDGVEFVVHDRGAGLAAIDVAQARERFWRRGNGEGSGLGLSIVDAIAERYGGRFTLLRSTDGGTEARLVLPLLDDGTP
jgi:two-component system, OmpR family, sensor histidine kinase QseC